MRNLALCFIGIIFILNTSCKEDNSKEDIKSFVFEFDGGTEDWSGDFADYPLTDSVFYELTVGYSRLPHPLDTSKGAIRISGNNHSDDLFMFIKRKISGLKPNTSYKISFDIEFASNAPTHAIGVGGAPGEGVRMGVGATKMEPIKIIDGEYYRMNIDKINQANPGNDMDTIGHVGVSDTTTVFTLITRNNKAYPFTVASDTNGSIWVIVGTDSGFEATTTLYYKKIKIELIEIE
jgi:hypothetical protein